MSDVVLALIDTRAVMRVMRIISCKVMVGGGQLLLFRGERLSRDAQCQRVPY